MAHGDSHRVPLSLRDDSQVRMDSEPTIADYLLVLVRRKWLIIMFVAAGIAAGLLHILLIARTYSVQTVIEIGRVSGDKLIDQPETILAKLTHGYVPDVLQAYRTEQPEGPRIGIKAKIPKDSEVVVLDSQNSHDAAIHLSLHQNVAQRLVRDHQRTADHIIKQHQSDLSRARLKLEELTDRRVFMVQEKLLQGEIERGQLRLEALRDHAKLIETEAKRFDDTKKLLTRQVADLRADISSATEHRTRATTQATDGASAMTLLMLDSQIVDSRSRLRTLEERLYISLDNDREKLLKQMADIQRDQEAQIATISELGSKLVKLRADSERERQFQQQTIADVENKLASVRTTAILTPPAQSSEPTGLGRAVVLLLYALLGVMGGVFAAFLGESLQRATSRPLVFDPGIRQPETEAEAETVMWERR